MGKRKITSNTTHFFGKNYDNRNDISELKDYAAQIELNLEALGFTIRVVEVNVLDGFYEFHIEVAVGTDLQKLEKHDRMLAMVLASPTGKVYWQIPVPGKSVIGLKLPRIPSKSPKLKPVSEETDPVKRNLRMKLASIFYSVGRFNFNIAQKITGVK